MKKILLCCFLFLPTLAFAQMPGGQSKEPVSIEASSQLEWRRDQNLYRATKDVVITQGATVIKGDMAEAEYDPKIGQSAITIMTVTGNVSVVSNRRTLTADKGIYDTRSKILTMTGNVITLTTPDAKVTSTESMTYDANQGIATATGHAVVTEVDKQLKADKIIAVIDPATNKLQHADATGNVLITHKAKDGTDIAQAQHATYDMSSDVINLKGDVKLTRGTNHMQGDAAMVNLKTGVSNLKNNSTQGGRVRAIFTPGDNSSPMPVVTGAMPNIKAKNQYEQPYAVDKNNRNVVSGNRNAQGLPSMPGN